MKAATAAPCADRSVSECRLAGRHRAVPAERLLQVAGRLPGSGRRSDARGVRAHHRVGPAGADRRAGSRDGPPHDVSRPQRRRVPESRSQAHRSAESRAAQRARRIACACTCAGATTKGRIITTFRWSACCRWSSRAKIGALLIEGANPRHAHEWAVFRDFRMPRGQDRDSRA